MGDDETAKGALIRIVYSKIDAGLYKGDAYEIADAIEALIEEKIAEMLEQISERLEANLAYASEQETSCS